jgi:extracellular matrix regulatory protein A
MKPDGRPMSKRSTKPEASGSGAVSQTRLQNSGGSELKGLINIGFGNAVASGKVVAVVTPGSSPTRRLKDQASQKGKLVDATEGRRTRALLVMDSDHVVLSAIAVETITQRMGKCNGDSDE